jgi:RimJ/RimL family protein N-acetyltransferase
MSIIQTERLILRQWRDSDRQSFARLNADPLVMKHFPETLTRAQSDAQIDRFRDSINRLGYGFFSVQLRSSPECIGFIGVNFSESGLPFAPCSDIGWRLSRAHWGRGYATEGAKASMDFVFQEMGVQEIVSITPVSNVASERVMQKIGLTKQSPNFIHPGLKQGHHLAEHLLYKINKSEWLAVSNRDNQEH